MPTDAVSRLRPLSLLMLPRRGINMLDLTAEEDVEPSEQQLNQTVGEMDGELD